ncbi:hypothetical protein C0991_011403 [Blastosporella zonata]|nr:hypothetical protein C0991_011403 [Blastosporella zonata]
MPPLDSSCVYAIRAVPDWSSKRFLAWQPTLTYPVLAASSSSTAPRQKLKTPMIAGSVCGGVMGIAWIIGFTIYFRKRYRRKILKRKIAEGKAVQKTKPSKIPDERIIVPPDPAILLGHRLPGENAFRDADDGEQEPNGDFTQHLNGTPSLRLDNAPYTSIPVASEEMLITRK